MSKPKRMRRYVAAVAAIGTCAALSPVVSVATAQVGSSLGADNDTTVTANTTTDTDTGTGNDTPTQPAADPDLTLPTDEPVNLAVDGVGSDGAPQIAFLREALDLATKFAEVDTGTGVVRILDALLNGKAGESSSGSGGATDGTATDEGASTDEDPAKDGTKFEATELPEFLEQLDNGVVTGDTTGVAPGKYVIVGTMTDPAGREVPVELTLSVGEPAGTDEPGEPTPPGSTTATTASSTTATTASSTTATTASSTTATTASSTTATTASSTTATTAPSEPTEKASTTTPTTTTKPATSSTPSTTVTYKDTKVTAGDATTVKPEGATDGLVFVSTGNPDWVKVDPTTGVVTLSPTTGTAAGDNLITVHYSSSTVESLLADVRQGDLSALKKATFTATVTKGESDATANSTTNGTTGTGGGAGTASNPAYVATGQGETLPVTGVNAQMLLAAMLGLLLASGGATLWSVRKARA